MQPTAPEIDRGAVALPDAECSTPDPIARFEQQHVHAGLDKAARRGDSGGARADHDDIVLISNFVTQVSRCVLLADRFIAAVRGSNLNRGFVFSRMV